MSQLTDTIVATGAAALRYAEGLLKDIKPDQFARLPSPGGKPIQTNHPAFVYGHLSLYPRRILGFCEREADVPAAPPKFDDLFKNGQPCLDDPAGTIYPPMDAIVAHYIAATKAGLAALPKVDDAVLAKPNPVEGRFRELFPTIGVAANFLLGGAHSMSHLGQISAWRRCMNLPSAF